jgi:hypothetical protein
MELLEQPIQAAVVVDLTTLQTHQATAVPVRLLFV